MPYLCFTAYFNQESSQDYRTKGSLSLSQCYAAVSSGSEYIVNEDLQNILTSLYNNDLVFREIFTSSVSTGYSCQVLHYSGRKHSRRYSGLNRIREEDMHVALLEELEKRGWKLEEKRCCQKNKKEEMHRAATSNMQEEVKWTFKH